MLGKLTGSSESSLTVNIGGELRMFQLDCNCKVTLNGKNVKATDLRPGDDVEVDGKPAVRVTAKRSP